ncbi:type II toxin-antitoxin system VapC family toxin [Inquilinus sp. KBS0705]|nr:type II toxin-antitoxin system VapC family toxin [Inquilinus sp. KBS0705]
MSGTDIFIDTNICIYLLNGDAKLAKLLQDQSIHISFITEIELFAYHGQSDTSVNILKAFINSVTLIDISNDIKQKTIDIRRNYKMKLPDSIIAASSLTKKLPFVTADKNFKKIPDLDLVLYELS